MLGMKEIIKEAEALPVDERVAVVDSLLRSLNPPDPDVDKQWVDEAKRRLAELRSGQVEPVAAERILAKLQGRFPVP